MDGTRAPALLAHPDRTGLSPGSQPPHALHQARLVLQNVVEHAPHPLVEVHQPQLFLDGQFFVLIYSQIHFECVALAPCDASFGGGVLDDDAQFLNHLWSRALMAFILGR